LKTLVIHANLSTTITVVCPLAHHDRDDLLSDSLTFPKRKLIQRILLAEDDGLSVTLTKKILLMETLVSMVGSLGMQNHTNL
jgi:hypothetical protein